jgi:predicted GNAT family acetyltransferase
VGDETRDRVLLTADDGDALGGMRAAGMSLGTRLVVSDIEDRGIYEATLGGVVAAGVVYARDGRRVTLLATSVFPQFRSQGVAAAVLTRVLDGIRRRGETVTVTCPFTARFLESHPEYGDLIDPDLPGVPHHRH